MTNKIKAILGLGNPGPKHHYQRHNIGFRVLDQLAAGLGGQWQRKDETEQATIVHNGEKVLLIKPQTFMNSSGQVIPALLKQGIKAENILVVHDELEIPFGAVKLRLGGSHRGHNGLRSIIGVCGEGFRRIRCGIGRPAQKEEVPDYVLKPFSESEQQVDQMIAAAEVMIVDMLDAQ
jgi:PTH1 family peptidyl-tRNA hydrolase